MIEDNVIPLIDPNEVNDEVVTDDYELGYAEGLEVAVGLNERLTDWIVENGHKDKQDFIDGIYDAIVENLDI